MRHLITSPQCFSPAATSKLFLEENEQELITLFCRFSTYVIELQFKPEFDLKSMNTFVQLLAKTIILECI
jgi:hypothetical protein